MEKKLDCVIVILIIIIIVNLSITLGIISNRNKDKKPHCNYNRVQEELKKNEIKFIEIKQPRIETNKCYMKVG